MPGLTTHTYILYRALCAFERTAPSMFQPIVASHRRAITLAQNHDASALAEDEESILQGCAYIGCCGPDLFYLELGSEGVFLADLLHYNRSGPFIVRWLCELRENAVYLAKGKPQYIRQLAYCLGHISHIAADIVIHPFVNSIVGAYPENAKKYVDARGSAPPLWKFHNKLEHYQDAYVLHQHFISDEKFCKGSHFGDLNCVNLALPAALRLYQPDGTHFLQQGWRAASNLVGKWTGKGSKAPLPPLGLVEQTRSFYGYANDLSSLENAKYGFFADVAMSGNYTVNVSHYYEKTLPDERMMNGAFHLVQPKLFDSYIDKAVALTLEMWREAAAFLGDGTTAKSPDFAAPATGQMARLSGDELKKFDKLSRHWNLDCGLAPRMAAGSGTQAVPDTPDTWLHVPGQLVFRSVHRSAMDDVQPFH